MVLIEILDGKSVSRDIWWMDLDEEGSVKRKERWMSGIEEGEVDD